MILTINIDELDPDIIKFYEKTDNKSKIQDALIHGFKIVNCNTYALNLKNSDQQNTQKIAELSTQNSAHVTHIADLQSQIQALKNDHILQIEQSRQTLKTEFNKQIYDIEQSNLKRETEIRTLSENAHSQRLQNLESELSDYKNQLKEANQRCLTIQDNARLDYQPRIDKLQQELEQKNSVYNNSSKKGGKGEEEMEIILPKLFPNAKIIRKSKEKRSGDFRIDIHGVQVLFENKNYQRNVDREEIDKFIRDCEVPDIDCGIMCSENCGIAKKEDMEIEIIDGKPLIYLWNTRSDVDKIKIAVTILVNIIQNDLEMEKGDIQEIKDLIRNIDTIKAVCQDNEKNINNLQQNNKDLIILNNRTKYRLEEITSKIGDDTKKKKRKCEYCEGSFVDLDKHISKKHSDRTI